MPQGGNFGGASIPDVLVGGNELLNGSGTTYKDYTCKQAISTGSSANYTYTSEQTGGLPVTITLGNAGTVGPEMVIVPQQVLTVSNVAFLCYSFDCDQPMTGTTAFDDTVYGYIVTATTVTQAGATATNINPNTAFAPTIIGCGGLNN